MFDQLAAQSLSWIGIVFCISQSAMFSGLNLAFFSLSRLRLEVEAKTGDKNAVKVLAMRQDSNFLLTTILWGNVGINVLLTLLSDSVMAGLGAFFFSTIVITTMGEILPQAYFSRNALRMAALLAPVLRFYQILLYVVAKPTAKLLDAWLGDEGIHYLRERGLRELIHKHIEADEADVDRIEGLGALNFLAIDDLLVTQEGEPVDPNSVISLPVENDKPQFPAINPDADDPFLRLIDKSRKKWVIVTCDDGIPCVAIDADGFLRAALFGAATFNPYRYCHRPEVVTDLETQLGDVVSKLIVKPRHHGDDVIDHDIILVWGDEKRVITGADLLGRLMRGIAEPVGQPKPA
jgi:metal transporter CNNM